MLRTLLILFVLTSASQAIAQRALLTYASQFTKKYKDTTDEGDWKYFSYFYNDEGVLDSLRFRSHFVRELGGLSKMKPFIRELYDAESLPPSIGAFSYGRSDNLRLVLTEPTPGQIRIFESELVGSDSIAPIRTIEYDYDTRTGRVLRAGSNKYLYRDSAGLIASVEWDSGSFMYQKWNFIRDTDGVIVALERLAPQRALDSLYRHSWYQVLNWVPKVSALSARRTRELWSSLDDLPWLPEGEPAVWFKQSWSRFGKPHSRSFVERIFDDHGRMTSEWSRTKVRKIDYDSSGRITMARSTDHIDMVHEAKLWSRGDSTKMPWYDVVLEYANGTWDRELRHLFTYEYGYRYDDGLWGDRYAPHLYLSTSEDTISLTIGEHLPVEGLTACVIDTAHNELAQLQLSGRETHFVFGDKERKMGQAIRWKYRGRKIVDQAY